MINFIKAFLANLFKPVQTTEQIAKEFANSKTPEELKRIDSLNELIRSK